MFFFSFSSISFCLIQCFTNNLVLCWIEFGSWLYILLAHLMQNVIECSLLLFCRTQGSGESPMKNKSHSISLRLHCDFYMHNDKSTLYTHSNFSFFFLHAFWISWANFLIWAPFTNVSNFNLPLLFYASLSMLGWTTLTFTCPV